MTVFGLWIPRYPEEAFNLYNHSEPALVIRPNLKFSWPMYQFYFILFSSTNLTKHNRRIIGQQRVRLLINIYPNCKQHDMV